jgi:hypothetical protein
MTSLRSAFFNLKPNAFPSVLNLISDTSGPSVQNAILELHNNLQFQRNIAAEQARQATLERLRDLFGGGTSEGDEDTGLNLFLSATSSADLIFYIQQISWSEMDDELDEPDMDAIAEKLSLLLQQENHPIYALFWRYLGAPDELLKMRQQDFLADVTRMPIWRQRELIDDLLAARDTLLTSLIHSIRRGLESYYSLLQRTLDFLVLGTYRQAELITLRWEASYANQIVDQWSRGQYSLLISLLPDLVNPNLPTAQRLGLAHIVDLLKVFFEAMELFASTLGDDKNRQDAQTFQTLRLAFINNVPPANAPPGVFAQAFQAILTAINGVIGGLQQVRDAALAAARQVSNFGFSQLMDTASDDKAFNLINILSDAQLTVLPYLIKNQLIHLCLTGVAEDEEEQAALKMLRIAKEHSLSEFFQLVKSISWERLDSNFDGQEHESLVRLFDL